MPIDRGSILIVYDRVRPMVGWFLLAALVMIPVGTVVYREVSASKIEPRTGVTTDVTDSGETISEVDFGVVTESDDDPRSAGESVDPRGPNVDDPDLDRNQRSDSDPASPTSGGEVERDTGGRDDVEEVDPVPGSELGPTPDSDAGPTTTSDADSSTSRRPTTTRRRPTQTSEARPTTTDRPTGTSVVPPATFVDPTTSESPPDEVVDPDVTVPHSIDTDGEID